MEESVSFSIPVGRLGARSLFDAIKADDTPSKPSLNMCLCQLKVSLSAQEILVGRYSGHLSRLIEQGFSLQSCASTSCATLESETSQDMLQGETS